MSSPNRNDPCPCGSGTKYKACCLERDRAADRALALVGAAPPRAGEEPWNPAVRAAEVWEADVVPLNTRFHDDPEACPAIAVVGAATYLVHGEVLRNRPFGLAARAQEVANAVLAAARRVGVLPPELHVRDQALARELAPELAPRGIAVRMARMPDLDEAIAGSLRELSGERGGVAVTPGRWAETEATREELAALHAAAAAFHRAAPWRLAGDDMPFRVEFDDGGGDLYAAVMGNAEIDVGLALYSDLDDYLEIQGDDLDAYEQVERMAGWALSLTYDRDRRLSRAMRREVTAAGWEVAAPGAFPLLFGIRVPGYRVTAEHVTRMTRAIAAVLRQVCGADAARALDDPRARAHAIGRPGMDRPARLWAPLHVCHPIGPVGRNADPEAAIDPDGWAGFDRARWDLPFIAEDRRVDRFAAWLEKQPLSKAARRRHLRNARVWSSYVAANARTAAAVTEYDLRTYLYDWFPRRETVARDVEKALPESLGVFFGWLKARQGIRYPWAAAVLEEFEGVRLARAPAPVGHFWEEEVMNWRAQLWGDLDGRVMIPDTELPRTPNGWPPVTNAEVTRLRGELQRRWLIWYDEVVRAGIASPPEVWEALVARQRAWEDAPHPGLKGRTPRDAVLHQEANPPSANALFQGA